MKVLMMYLHFPIFKLLPSSTPKLHLLHFKNLFWCLLNVNFCHNNFAKLHRSHMTLNPFEIFLKHEKLCLLLSLKILVHLISYNERSCYFLEVTSNWDLNTKWLTIRFQQFQTPWDFERHVRYMSSISIQNFSSIGDNHKELSLSKETDFKTKVETLDIWIFLNTYPNDLKFRYSPLWSIRSQNCKSKKAQRKEIWSKNQIWHKIFKNS